LVKEGKNHVAWNENPPETAANLDDDGSGEVDNKTGDPPRTNLTAQVKSASEFEEMKKHLEKLKTEERELDKHLDYLNKQAAVFNGQKALTSEMAAYLPPVVQNISDHMYVRFKDITTMSQYSEDTVIGIRAPSGTSLEVPDPDQGMHPGARRYEMYLSSKGAESAPGEGKRGDPINVYLVQPQADKPDKGGRAAGKERSFVQHPSAPSAKRKEVSRGDAHLEMDDRPSLPDNRAPSHPYHQDHEWGPPDRRHGRPSYPPPSYRKDSYGPPPPGYYPTSGGPPPPYSDATWGPPPPEYYHQGPSQPSARASRPPPTTNQSSSKDVTRRGPGGSALGRDPNPFRPRAHPYHPHESIGASSSGEQFRPPTPTQQQNLMTLPLQSPNGGGSFGMPSSFYPSPYDTPPGSREQRGQFPVMPPLGREGSRDSYNHRDERWHPPGSSGGSGTSNAEPSAAV
jgi:hypothetical protein